MNTRRKKECRLQGRGADRLFGVDHDYFRLHCILFQAARTGIVSDRASPRPSYSIRTRPRPFGG
jgi:hypothetical protein